jgi:hypothetical protein
LIETWVGFDLAEECMIRIDFQISYFIIGVACMKAVRLIQIKEPRTFEVPRVGQIKRQCLRSYYQI